ncbi:MAG: RHS repeat-associated core domain-containing protein [Lysobacteraceae bacterium]
MPTPLPLVQPIESVTLTGTGSTARWESSRCLYDAQNRLSRQVEGAGSAAEHLICLEGYEDRVGGYRTRSYVDDYAHITRYRYGQLELRFLLTDRLGSVVGVVRVDRDSGGSVRALEPEVELAYDVFGAPRHASDWSPLVGAESWPQARSPWDVTPTTRHGFTGHEMLSKQRLIHMRGRLFDPRMGRFTGVDPVIQFPLSTQGLNPYSYLLNNPLAGTDPTGYECTAETGSLIKQCATVEAVASDGSRTTVGTFNIHSSGDVASISRVAVASNGATTAQTVGTQSITGGGAAALLSQANGPQTCSIKDDPNAFNGEHRALTQGESLRLDWNSFIDKETQYSRSQREPDIAKNVGDVIASSTSQTKMGSRSTLDRLSNSTPPNASESASALTLVLTDQGEIREIWCGWAGAARIPRSSRLRQMKRLGTATPPRWVDDRGGLNLNRNTPTGGGPGDVA